MRILIFLLVIVSVLGGVHLYFWLRLVRDTGMPTPWRLWATVACALLAVMVPLAGFTVRRLPPGGARVVALLAFGWLGVGFLLVVLLFAADLVRVLGAVGARLARGEPLDPERRILLSRAAGGAAAAATAVLGAIAVRRGLERAEVREIEVALARLGPEAEGASIVQLTDLHVGPTIGRAFVEDVVRRTNALAPDVVAITGDLVDGSVEQLRDAIAPLGELRARHGVYFVTGNHEFFSGARSWVAELERLGIRVLRNHRVELPGFDLAGMDDPSARRYEEGQAPDLAGTLAGRDPARELVLLAHQPRTVREAAQHGVGLQLSGHTHGGQIWPWGLFVRLQQPYVLGLHRHGPTQIYVSPGTGYWGPPMRLGTRAEITRIVLRRGTA